MFLLFLLTPFLLYYDFFIQKGNRHVVWHVQHVWHVRMVRQALAACDVSDDVVAFVRDPFAMAPDKITFVPGPLQ